MTTQTTQTAPAALPDKARLFRSLHVPGRPVVLPNAWDVASARVVADRSPGPEDTLSRAVAYAAAGADGIFVLGALDAGTVERLVAGSPLPVNVAVGPGTLSVAELAAAGVARVSAVSSIAEAAYGLAGRAARELLERGTAEELEGGADYATLNALLLDTPQCR